MKEVALAIIVFFGVFLIFCGFIMFFYPEKAKQIISKAGSTFMINYAELGIRLIVGLAFVFVETKFENVYNYFGYFLIVSALLLMILPIKKHNQFSKNASNYLKPIYLKILSPLSIAFGILVIYGII
ncbi:MAG: hypothetical protein V4666_07405 [Bacteroidota bacterium]